MPAISFTVLYIQRQKDGTWSGWSEQGHEGSWLAPKESLVIETAVAAIRKAVPETRIDMIKLPDLYRPEA